MPLCFSLVFVSHEGAPLLYSNKVYNIRLKGLSFSFIGFLPPIFFHSLLVNGLNLSIVVKQLALLLHYRLTLPLPKGSVDVCDYCFNQHCLTCSIFIHFFAVAMTSGISWFISILHFSVYHSINLWRICTRHKIGIIKSVFA